MVYPVGVFAALLLGTGYVLQQRVATYAPIADVLRWRLLLDLMRVRLWWAGIACMVVGQVLAGLALQLANVGLVEPLLSTNLLFALGMAALLSRQRPKRIEIGGALLLSAALGVFIAVGNPRSSPAPAPNDAIVALAVAVVAVVVAACVVIGRTRGRLGEAIWLATGAGLLYGLQDAATRAALVRIDHHGVLTIFVNVWVYVVVGSAVLGILLSQSAFKVGRLDHCLPPITAAEPIAGIALGICLLGDVLSVSIVGLAAESACLLAMVVGVALIARAPSLGSSFSVERVAAGERLPSG